MGSLRKVGFEKEAILSPHPAAEFGSAVSIVFGCVVEGDAFFQQSPAGNMANLETYSIRIFEEHVIIAWCPLTRLRPTDDLRSYLFQESCGGIDVVVFPGTKTKMMEPYASLNKDLTAIFRRAALDG